MRNTILNVRAFELCNCMIKKQCQNLTRKYCTDEAKYTLEKKKIIHPYRKLHPWKSLDKFSQYLLNNIIYNKDGLVAINKPYGISAKQPNINENADKVYSKVPNAADYTLSDSIPYIAKKLGYPELVVVKAPEKFMSGVTLLAANVTTQEAIQSSYVKAIGMNLLNKVYWIVTIRTSNQMQGKEHLCLKKEWNSSRSESKVIISDSWSKNAQKQRRVRILNVQFDVISNSTNNLSSLIELKASTTKWHALRLFASTRLYTPILGDNIYGTRIHKVGGAWLLVNPFTEAYQLPEVDSELLKLLHLTKAKQELIPCHIHARRVLLPKFLDEECLTLEAPLIPPLDWTCQQLKFKNIPEFEEKEKVEVSL
ncbi:hypothetical protein KPH14_002885 [Odynerus spinipes]|uniref:Pseudouridine synthase RsuA/RluA-like domain-containing protein n=1 Tax=Odynerus spinipes TaxID=1348599 RepID=A0AAD9RX66_9HYME|nr:hypothetical protein KPH14_002885 [Odynerus spinipes]